LWKKVRLPPPYLDIVGEILINRLRVYKPDGTEYISPGGDLFVWDKCAACAGGGRVDFSGKYSRPLPLYQIDSSVMEVGVGVGTDVELPINSQ
jgi:hypothetical protein